MSKIFFFLTKKKSGFTPCKAEQPLRGMKLQEIEEGKATGKLFRKSPKKKGVY